MTNSSTIKNYLRSMKEFLCLLRNKKLTISSQKDVAIAKVLRMDQENIENHARRIYFKNMNLKRQDSEVMDVHSYPYFSFPLKKLCLEVSKELNPATFSAYSFRVGLFVVLMNDPRPQILYKINRSNVLEFRHPTTGNM